MNIQKGKNKLAIDVVGLVYTVQFEKAKECAIELFTTNPQLFLRPQFQPMYELEWLRYLKTMQGKLVIKYFSSSLITCVFIDGSFFGSGNYFLDWARKSFLYSTCKPIEIFEKRAKHSYSKMIDERGYPLMYLTISINDEIIGRLLIELYDNILPETCKNFKILCEGRSDQLTEVGTKFTYKDTVFHRVVRNMFIQGGDIFFGRGDGGQAYTRKILPDECFAVSHSRRGIVSLANHGKHTNNSQFFIILKPCLWMNKRYVAFGQVIEGDDTLTMIENVPLENERPIVSVKIAECGLYNINILHS